MSYPNRTFCDTLHEMRKLVNNINLWNYTKSQSILLSLIEECQVYGNRMEAGLEYKCDMEKLHEKRKKLEKKIKKLRVDAKEEPSILEEL